MSHTGPDGRERLMLDPSFALSEDGIGTVRESLELDHPLLLPEAFAEWLRGERSFDPEALIAEEDLGFWEERFKELREYHAAGRLPSFFRKEARLDPDAQEVLFSLQEGNDEAAELWADEWAFLQSNSWLGSKLDRCLDAFERAGATVLKAGREARTQLLLQVLPPGRIPPSLTAEVIVRAGLKWVVLGGAGYAAGHLVGTAVGGPAGPLIGRLTSKVVKVPISKCLIALDP